MILWIIAILLLILVLAIEPAREILIGLLILGFFLAVVLLGLAAIFFLIVLVT